MTAVRRTSASNLAKYQAVTLENIFETVAGQAMGFHFGKPKRIEDKALAVVLPILRDGEIGRDYITYSETEGVLATDSGSINKVNLKNTTDHKVFVRSGTVFAGKGTQSRVITRSAILMPKSDVSLDARCVHASHGIHTGSSFDNYGTISIDIERSVYGAGFQPKDQSTFWSAVNASNLMKSTYYCAVDNRDGVTGTTEYSLDDISIFNNLGRPQGGELRPSFGGLRGATRPSFGGLRGDRITGATASAGQRSTGPSRRSAQHTQTATPPRDSFVGNDTVFTANLDDILAKVKLHENQVGLSLITDRGVETIELFEVNQSWAALHKDSVKRMGTELIKEEKEDVFEYKPEKAIEQVTRVLALNFDANVIFEHKADGADKVVITGLTSASHIGEAVELGGKLIHLSLLKRAA
jgi:hypothetical protein